MKMFPAKLLLFGEYSVLVGSHALAMPYPTYFGQLTKSNLGYPLGEYLLHLLSSIEVGLDKDKLRLALDEEWCYDGNIPIGYGLGSSGALVAAVWDWAGTKEEDTDLLRHKLGLMENYFHGESSGIDPLVCFLNQTVLKSGNNNYTVLNHTTYLEPFGIGLVDSGTSRNTGNLVSEFLKMNTDENFSFLLHTQYIPYVEQAIQAYLKTNLEELFVLWKSISQFQYKYFKPMIPKKIKQLWAKGLKNNSYYLKLCGAGGGGFFLKMVNPAQAS